MSEKLSTRIWSEADEAAYVAATSSEAPIVAEEPSPDRTRGDRYMRLRVMLAKNAPLGLSDYLAAQQLMVMMDMMAEIDELRAAIEDTNAYLHEHIVRQK